MKLISFFWLAQLAWVVVRPVTAGELDLVNTIVLKYQGFCPDAPCQIASITHWKFCKTGLTGDRLGSLIQLLEQFPGLQRLDLEGNPITDDDIKKIVDSKLELVELNLDGTRITDKSVVRIAHRYTELNSLGLNCTKVGDAALQALVDEKRDMYYLHLGNTRVTDAGMRHVACFTNLRDLNVALTKVTGRGLGIMAGIDVESASFRTFLVKHRVDWEGWESNFRRTLYADNYPRSDNYPNQPENSQGEFMIELARLDLEKMDWLIRQKGVQGLERLWWARSGIRLVDLWCLQTCQPHKKIAFFKRPDF